MTGPQQPTDQTPNLKQRLDVDFTLEAAGLGVWEYDPLTGQANWDERCRALYGLAKGNSISYEQAFQYIHPDDANVVKEAVAKVLTPPSDGRYDVTYRTIGGDDGKLRWVRFQGKAQFTAAGEMQRFGGVAQEVTQRVLDHQKVEASETHLQLLRDTVPAMIFHLDLEQRYQSYNGVFRDWFGVEGDQAIGKTVREFLGEEAYQQTRPHLAKAYSGHVERYELYAPSSMNTDRWLSIVYTPHKTPDGNVTGIIAHATDITQSKRSELDLRASEARFRSLVEEAPVATCLFVGRQMRIELANQAMIQVWGKGPDVIGLPLAEALPELKNQHFLTTLDDLFTTGNPYEAKGGRADLVVAGKLQTYYFNYDFKPLRNAEGEVYAILETATDVTQQVLAQKRIEQTQRQLLNLFEESPVGLATYSADDDHVIQWANPFFGELVARPPQAIVGKPLLEALPELKGQGFDEILNNVIATGTPFAASEVAVGVLREGQLTTIHVNLTYQPQKGLQGEIQSILVVATDVTQQVQSRKLIQESEAKLRSIIEQAPVATGLFVGRDLIIELANEPILQLWGKGADVIGKPLAQVLPELVGQPFLQLLDQVYTTGQPYQASADRCDLVIEGQLRTFYFNFTYQPIVDEQGQVYAILDMAVDVTQQVLARQALEQQQEQQRFLLHLSDSLRSLNDPLAVYYQTACLVGEYLGANRVGYAEDQGDGNTIVVLRNYVNGVSDLQGTYQYADYGPLLAEFLAGRTVVRSDIAHDPTLTAAEKEAHRVLQLGATLNKPLVQDGRLVAVLFIHYQQAHAWSVDELDLLDMVAERLLIAVDRTQAEKALRQSEGRYRQLSGDLEIQVHQRTNELATTNEELAAINEELSANNEEYAAINEELEEANFLLGRSNDNLQQFAYVASHDLQEPLRKIQQFGDLLRTRYATASQEELSYLDRMQSAAVRMSVLIKDLLNYSRITSQRDTSSRVDLNQVVDDVLIDLELLRAETQARIDIDPLPVVEGNVGQLGQLFQNLLSNAIKFRRSGVAPSIQIKSEQLPANQLPTGVKPARPALSYHQIEVVDNGIGFDEKYLDRIFQVFQRLHGKSEYAGTGIGLAVCEKVVTNHGGSITATSQVGQGATFTIYLPA